MFIQLDVGWMNHPFPANSFKIASQAQLETLRSLGLQSVRCIPGKSDNWPQLFGRGRQAGRATFSNDASPEAQRSLSEGAGGSGSEHGRNAARKGLDVRQWRSRIAYFDARFEEIELVYEGLAQMLARGDQEARQPCEALIQECLAELLGEHELSIHLLSDAVGYGQNAHVVNVAVLSMLLGRSMGLTEVQLSELGLAALLHDAGKLAVGASHLHGLAVAQSLVSEEQRKRYQGHVGESVSIAMRLGLSAQVATAIAQHHEWADGSGFPLHLLEEDMDLMGQILALVDSYERLCNPGHAAVALQTPHEVLAQLFSSHKHRFAAPVLTAFIQMMGVFPPGSLVELSDGSQAMVMSVNVQKPLKPVVMLYQTQRPVEDALLLDLEQGTGLCIRRGLAPGQVPCEVLDYLSPRRHVCYYFERAAKLDMSKARS